MVIVEIKKRKFWQIGFWNVYEIVVVETKIMVALVISYIYVVLWSSLSSQYHKKHDNN